MKYFYSLTLALFFVIMTIIQSGCTPEKPQKLHLKIYQTTDVHGAIFPRNFIDNRPSSTSLAQIHGYIEKQRSQDSTEIILLDNGDILQGQPTVYYYNFQKTSVPHLLSRVMNYMQYDAGTVGNHDIEAGHAVYDRFAEELNFPWMAANAVSTESNEPYFEPYTIIEKQGVKIAILGLITPGIPKWLPENIWEGIVFEDMIETAQKWVTYIQQEEKPDLIIGMFHSGVDPTYGNADPEAKRNENASKLVAQQVDGFDIVMAGHDHQRVNEIFKNNFGHQVVLVDPQSSARLLAEVNIDLLWDKNQGEYKKIIRAEMLDVSKMPVSEEFMDNFKPEFDEVQQYVDQKVATIRETVNSRSAYFEDNALMDLIHNIQLELTDADISFTAPLSFETRLDSGALKVSDMFKIYKYENLLYTMSLTGQEVKDYLEYSYSLWMNTMTSEADTMLRYKKGGDKLRFAESFYNFDSAEGIQYTVDLSKEAGNRIMIQGMADGSDFDVAKTYKVAINSYRGNGGGGHLTNGAHIPANELSSRIEFSTDKDLRFYIMKWLEEKQNVSMSVNKNWKVIPEAWAKKASRRELNMLFRN